MLKFLRKCGENVYFKFFVSMYLGFIIVDIIMSKDINLLYNFFRALLAALIYAFFDWAWDSKVYKKKS